LAIVNQPADERSRRRAIGAHTTDKVASVAPVPLRREIEPLLRKLRESPELSAQSRAKLLDLLDRFAAFLTVAQDVTSLAEVTQAHVELFTAAAPNGNTAAEPAVATMHFRRSAVRLLFRLARQSGLEFGDPALDVQLPPRPHRQVRPLTDGEIVVCRGASLHTLAETRLPAAWALAKATAPNL
jgi:site-specific recombinase XerD